MPWLGDRPAPPTSSRLLRRTLQSLSPPSDIGGWRRSEKAGQAHSWDMPTRDGDVGWNTVFTMGSEEEVEVPAGKFRVLRVDSVTTREDRQIAAAKFWYAPAVGLVKKEETFLGGTTTEVLKYFTPGK